MKTQQNQQAKEANLKKQQKNLENFSKQQSTEEKSKANRILSLLNIQFNLLGGMQ